MIPDNDSKIIENAIEAYGRLILTLCCSMVGDYFESEDIAQETFVSAYRNLTSFDGVNMKAWLVRIATNKCRDYLKSAARRSVPSSDEILVQTADHDPIPEEKVLQKDTEKKLRAFCENLKEPYRSTAVLYFCRNQSAQEISKMTGKNLKTTQTQIYRAKAMIRKQWEEEFG